MSKLVIFGTGGIAKVAYYYFTHDSYLNPVAFTVDKEFKQDDKFLDKPVVSFENIEEEYPPDEYSLFIAMSYQNMNNARYKKYQESVEKGYKLVSYVSSRCSFLTENSVGENCFILEDNTIQPYVDIGDNVVLWSGNHIGHDSIIEDHCFISSHVVVSGNVNVGKNSFIGVNATLRDGIQIAPKTLIGAGATIMENTDEEGVYISERAKKIDKKSVEVDI